MSKKGKVKRKTVTRKTAPVRKSVMTRNSQKNSFTVSRREYIGRYSLGSTPSTFEAGCLKFILNPGNSITFPWLSPIANRFETYVCRKLKFHLVFRNPTSTTGRFICGIDHDPADGLPGGEMELMNFQDTISGPVWGDYSLSVRPQNLQKRKEYYTRGNSSLSDSVGLRSSDLGNLFVFVDAASGASWPDVFVEYSFIFKTPQMPNGDIIGCYSWEESGIGATDQMYNPGGYYGSQDAPAQAGTPRLIDPLTSDDFYLQKGTHLVLRALKAVTSVDAMPALTASGGNSVNPVSGLLNNSGADIGVAAYVAEVEDEDAAFAIPADTITGDLEWYRMLVVPITRILGNYLLDSDGLGTEFLA